MKKKILGGIALLAIAAVAAWNVSLNSQSNDLSDISLANVEALAEENKGCSYRKKEKCETESEYKNNSGQKCKTRTTTISCSGTGGSICCTPYSSTTTTCF
jgi:hypothetical protein